MTVRRLLLIAAACATVALIAVTLTLVASWSDPNHQTEEQVVRHGGVPASVTLGRGQ
jgi:hypothetical protein